MWHPFCQSIIEFTDIAKAFIQYLQASWWPSTFMWSNMANIWRVELHCFPTCKLEYDRLCTYPFWMLHDWIDWSSYLEMLENQNKSNNMWKLHQVWRTRIWQPCLCTNMFMKIKFFPLKWKSISKFQEGEVVKAPSSNFNRSRQYSKIWTL